MKYLFVLVYLLITAKSWAQEITYPDRKDKSVIRIEEFYDGCGKIFDIKDDALLPEHTRSTFLLEVNEISFAEKLMDEKFTDLVKSDDRLKVLTGKTYKRQYYHFYRQYVGLINNEGDKMVLIHYIKCCKKNINRCFPDWEKQLSGPLDEDPCTITGSYVVNLSQRSVSAY